MKKQKVVFVIAALAALIIVALGPAPARADRIKVSIKGEDLAGCPNNNGSVIRMLGTDATQATGTVNTKRFRGDQGFTKDAAINSGTAWLMCNGTRVDLSHNEVSMQTNGDPPDETITFPPITISQYHGIDSISPGIDTQAVWCTLYLPENTGCTWEYPDALLLDRVPPDISVGNFETFPLVAKADGQVYWSWFFQDPLTPPDPDGENGTGCDAPSNNLYDCNKTDTRLEWQVYVRDDPELYGTTSIGTTDGSLFYLPSLESGYTGDRLQETPDKYCFVARISDSAGNWSATFSQLNTHPDTQREEKCVLPDSNAPEFEKIEYFLDFHPVAGYSGDTFAEDDFGNPIVTTNPCHFATSTCDISANRYIHLRIVVSEPLFDLDNYLGAQIVCSDGIDNDNDGNTDGDDEPGGFDGIDNDNDGLIDEDVACTTNIYPETDPPGNPDRIDNDANGYVDENHQFNPGDDSHGDLMTCGEYELWSRAITGDYYAGNTIQDTCMTLPRIFVVGPDSEGTTSGIGDEIEWVCTQTDLTDATTHEACKGLDYGQTVYHYAWRVGRPEASDAPPIGLEEGEFIFTFTGSDGVGNLSTQVEATTHTSVWVDNSPPSISVNYYSDDTFSSKFISLNHDNDAATPDMAIVPEGNMYIQAVATKFLGATPSLYIFKPGYAEPAYEGEPQPDDYATPTLYMSCNQDDDCDWCTGENCIAYDPVSNPCKMFRACFTVDDDIENGYAAVTMKYMDLLNNRKWHETTEQANADQWDSDQKSDDAGEDGDPDTPDDYTGDEVPNFVSASPVIEPDTDLAMGQFFAIDTVPPATPAISLPIAPCNKEVARANMSCLPSANTVNNPTLTWTTLGNGIDDDLDSSTDEECVDGVDEDGDGLIDEDADVCEYSDTPYWQVSQWRLQVSTTPDFQDGTMIFNQIVDYDYYNMPVLDERPAETPYYWRVAPADGAINLGPYNPEAPLVATDEPYFTFFVDTRAPEASVEYYTDEDCTISMPTNGDGIPVTGDTYRDPDAVVCMDITMNEPVATSTAMPVLGTYQTFLVQSTTTVAVPAGASTTFRAIMEIDTNGVYEGGEVEVKLTTEDLYNNEMDAVKAATGGVFIIDSTPAECIINSADPDPASDDNDRDGETGELVEDAVTVSFYCNKYIGATTPLRVIQNNFPAVPQSNDGIDNDCDGLIDEGDAGDPGTIQQPGSGCLVTTSYTSGGGDTFVYEGLYNVVPMFYDGTAQMILGDTASNSQYFLTDQIGSVIYDSNTFEVDTTGPPAPTLESPAAGETLSTPTPTFKWKMSSAPSDMLEYLLEVATSAVFTDIAASSVIDDIGQTTYNYTLLPDDVAECEGYSYDGCDDYSAYTECEADENCLWSSGYYCGGYSTQVSCEDDEFCEWEAVYDCSGYSVEDDCENDSNCNWAADTCTAASCTATVPPSCGPQAGLTCPGLDDNDGNPYYWRVIAFDEAYNRSGSGFVKSFIIDSEPPDPPMFNNVTTPTSNTTSPLSGTAMTGAKIEKNAQVNIYVNEIFIGSVTTDQYGAFDLGTDSGDDFGIDYDNDGYYNEDPVNGADDDNDDKVDEDPPGIFLTEGENIIEGLVIDSGGNVGSRGCSESTPFYDTEKKKCIIVLDSGAPKFLVSYYSDAELTTPLATIDGATGKQTASAGDVYLHITALEAGGLPSPPTFSVTTQGTAKVNNKSTEPIEGSDVYFRGTFTVNAHNPPEYVDGDAEIVVIGEDSEGNVTPDGTLPEHGAYLNIDTRAPIFSVTYWSDSKLLEPMNKSIDLYPITTAGKAYLRITSSERLSAEPTIIIDQPGTSDDSGTASKMDSTYKLFKYAYTVSEHDGSSYIDGYTSVTFNATDMAGNTASGTIPTLGATFVIDTRPPSPPIVRLTSDGSPLETSFDQITSLSNGSIVYDHNNNREPFAYIEAFRRLDKDMTADDQVDNDGDGRMDEEPNGSDGIDNDGDNFIDEDVSDNSCDSDQIWDTIYGECTNPASDTGLPDGTALADNEGVFDITISGFIEGVNYVYARATDMAGNTSDLGSASIVLADPVLAVTLKHTFSAGWNLVGVPLNPGIVVPNAALGLGGYTFFELDNNEYVYDRSLENINSGKCYWVYFDQEVEAESKGTTSVKNQLQLIEGWNMISLPYNDSVAWSTSTISISSGGYIYEIGSEQANTLIEPYVYEYDGEIEPGEYTKYGLDDGHTLQPWVGFLVKTEAACTIIFPDPLAPPEE